MTHLLKQQLGLVLIVAAVVLEARLQVPARDELHHEVDAGLRVVDVEQLDDVRVVDALEDLHLGALEAEVLLQLPLLLDDLDGHLVAGAAVLRLPHGAERAAAQHVPDAEGRGHLVRVRVRVRARVRARARARVRVRVRV